MDLAFFAGGMPGIGEILIILFLVLLLFGAKKLPELSRSLGKSLSEFKRGREEGARALDEVTREPEKLEKEQNQDEVAVVDSDKKGAETKTV